VGTRAGKKEAKFDKFETHASQFYLKYWY